jgi:hypothetical protein
MIYSHEYACSELGLHEADGGNRGTVGAGFIWVGSLARAFVLLRSAIGLYYKSLDTHA